MDRVILESLNKIRNLESKELLNEVSSADLEIARKAGDVSGNAALGQLGAATAGKLGSKVLPATSAISKVGGAVGSKLIPGLGLVAGGADAYRRAKAGDWTGAALSGLGGIASTVPGLGTAASLGLMGAQAARDKMRTGSFIPDVDDIAAASNNTTPSKQAQPAAQPAQPQVPPGGDPKIFALQQKLIAQGAKITADGKMGPQTQTAMKQFPNVKLAENIKETKMSESQRIAELMGRLAQIENQAVAEGPLDRIKAGWDAVKGAGKKFATGISNPRSTNLPSGQNLPQKTGAALARNPGKTMAATAVGAGTLGYMAGKPGQQPTPPKPQTSSQPAKKPAAAPTSALSKAELDEFDAIARELANSQDPVAVELMGQYNALRSKLGAATPVPGEME